MHRMRTQKMIVLLMLWISQILKNSQTTAKRGKEMPDEVFIMQNIKLIEFMVQNCNVEEFYIVSEIRSIPHDCQELVSKGLTDIRSNHKRRNQEEFKNMIEQYKNGSRGRQLKNRLLSKKLVSQIMHSKLTSNK